MISTLIKSSALAMMLLSITLPASAQASNVSSTLSNFEQVGEARLKVMFWNVFDAALYSQSGSYNENEAFALTLTYLRPLKGEKIVDATMEEIRRLATSTISDAQLQDWNTRLNKIIPDVSKGMSITGVRTPEGFTELYVGDDKKGSFDDVAFTDAFFSIWLGEDTKEPVLRAKLIGLETAS